MAKKSFSKLSSIAFTFLLLKGLLKEDAVAVAAFESLETTAGALESFLVADNLEVLLEDYFEDFLRYLSPKFSFLLFSGFFIPTIVKASATRLLLMNASKGASVAKDGERFTSINQGL